METEAGEKFGGEALCSCVDGVPGWRQDKLGKREEEGEGTVMLRHGRAEVGRPRYPEEGKGPGLGNTQNWNCRAW